MKKTRPVDRYSTIKKLREENKSNEMFEIMIGNISLEELIALKLEISTRSVGTLIYGLPWLRSMTQIVKDAILRYAMSVTPSKSKAMQYLGIQKFEFYKLFNKYGLREYYDNPRGQENEYCGYYSRELKKNTEEH